LHSRKGEKQKVLCEAFCKEQDSMAAVTDRFDGLVLISLSYSDGFSPAMIRDSRIESHERYFPTWCSRSLS
jgi:hypothetical protein